MDGNLAQNVHISTLQSLINKFKLNKRQIRTDKMWNLSILSLKQVSERPITQQQQTSNCRCFTLFNSYYIHVIKHVNKLKTTDYPKHENSDTFKQNARRNVLWDHYQGKDNLFYIIYLEHLFYFIQEKHRQLQ